MTNDTGGRTAENDALVGVIRSNGQAMFHTQDCAHAKRAMSAHYYLPSDFAAGDLWCSSCRPDLIERVLPPEGSDR